MARRRRVRSKPVTLQSLGLKPQDVKDYFQAKIKVLPFLCLLIPFTDIYGIIYAKSIDFSTLMIFFIVRPIFCLVHIALSCLAKKSI